MSPTTKSRTRHAGIYCRISRDDGRALGVNRQRADTEALAERLGWDLAAVYIDNDCSAFSGKERPEYRRMLDDLKNGIITAVIAWHPDRLHRSPRELEDFIDLLEAVDAPVATCTAGDYDLGTPEGRLVARITGSVARKESEDKSRRLRRKHEELAVAGKVSGGGNRPFGFEADRVTVRPEEAELLRQAARRVLAGDKLYRIVADWTEHGIQTSTGAPWSTTSLKSTLVRPRVAGLREHRGEVVGKAVWPAILDEATWRQVRSVLTDPARRKNPVVRSYLLTGILRCQLCGAPMVAAPRSGTQRKGGQRGDSIRAYGCVKTSGGCGGVFGLAEPIEAVVTEAVLSALDGPALRSWRAREANGGDQSAQAAADAVAADEARLGELADMWADGQITRAEWMRSRERIEKRLDETRRHVASLNRRRPANVLGEIDNLREAWADLSLDRRQAIVSAVLDRVTLAPATGARNQFNPERVGLTWRA